MKIVIEHNLRSNDYLSKLFNNSDAFMLVGQEDDNDIIDMLVDDLLIWIDLTPVLYYDNMLLIDKYYDNDVYGYVIKNNINKTDLDNNKILFEVNEETLFYIKLKYEEELIESFWDFQSKINIKLRYDNEN